MFTAILAVLAAKTYLFTRVTAKALPLLQIQAITQQVLQE
jgi:hypothetical protein